MDELLSFLEMHGIPFKRFDHPAVFTTAESSKLPPMPGADTKNLFLKDEHSDDHFLVTVSHSKKVDLKALAGVLGVRRLTFGSPEKMQEYLGVTPGSVTLLGVMHDTGKKLEVWIDEEVWNAEEIQCHPLTNTATFVLKHEDMERFFAATGHEVHAVIVPAKV
jgi:Ala-tRNA(Pro) deacylase